MEKIPRQWFQREKPKGIPFTGMGSQPRQWFQQDKPKGVPSTGMGKQPALCRED